MDICVPIYHIAIIQYTQCRGRLEEFLERMQTNKLGIAAYATGPSHDSAHSAPGS
jgi:hypothetical protein